MIRFLIFSLLICSSLSYADDTVTFLGNVRFSEERIGTEIEQRFFVKIIEKYSGLETALPLLDLRYVRGINTQEVKFTKEEKVLFIAKKQSEGVYDVIEYIKFPDDMIHSSALFQAYKFILIEKLEREIQEQLAKHDFIDKGNFDFLYNENHSHEKVQYFRIAMPTYAFSAIRFYIEQNIKSFSEYYRFDTPQQYRLTVVAGKVIIEPKRSAPYVAEYPQL